jgi:hypothetical protein
MFLHSMILKVHLVLQQDITQIAFDVFTILEIGDVLPSEMLA